MPRREKSNFRLHSKNLYLTYPKCPISREEALSSLRVKISKPISHYAIAQERHEDESLHLHIILWLSSTLDVSNALFADLESQGIVYHGNYQGLKKEKECVTYVMKEDVNILTDDVDRLKNLKTGVKKGKLDQVAKSLMEGTSVREIVSQNPGLALMNHQKMINFAAWWKASQWNPLPLPPFTASTNQWDLDLKTWITENLISPPPAGRPLRSRNLYLYSKPGLRKTSLMNVLQKSYKTFNPPTKIHWWDGYNETTQLILFDEFRGGYPMGEMNKILDGQVVVVPRRGGDFTKVNNIPVIICANKPPETVYKFTDQVYVDAFVDRLCVIECIDFINVFDVNQFY